MGATLSWRGRELVGYTKGNKQISYSYDVDGMRYRKTVTENNSVTATYDYVYSDGTLILLTYTANGVSNTARFVYDYFGEPRGFMLNDTAVYLYIKNVQGDITGIVDENGNVLLAYSYTAWGNVTYGATSMSNMLLAATLSNVNPFTYRGYCYDYDIGMYYLQSRYYDPTICRFINADSTDYLGATGTLLSYNLFAYCENDGVNFVDETGTTIEIKDNSKYDTYAKKAFKLLKTLTDDTLKFSAGKVTIKSKCKEKNIKKYYGTYLIRDLIKSKYIVTISVENTKGDSQTVAENYNNSLFVYKKGRYSYGKGSHSIVTFYLKDNSKSSNSPLYVILAHELIHAYRDISGMSIDYNRKCSKHNCKLEECFVVGLYKPHYLQYFQSIYTENNIRFENGLIKRTYYVGW